MITESMPPGLIPAGGTPVFTVDTIPDALLKEHTLAKGHWGLLNVLEGSIVFWDLTTGNSRTVIAPGLVTIRPEVPHRVALIGPVICRIDFFQETGAESAIPDPGGLADEPRSG